MKVICIDASNFTVQKPLTEGCVYDAYESWHPDGYKIAGFEKNLFGGHAAYDKKRFIPLSNIDEKDYAIDKTEQLA